MQDLEIFLNNPNLFFSRMAPSQCTIGVSPVSMFGAPVDIIIDGENKLPTGILLSWGSPGLRNTSENRYRHSALPEAVVRSTKNHRMRQTSAGETVTHNMEISSQHSVKTSMSHSYSNDMGKRNFSKIAFTDARNQAYMNSIPGLTEKFAAFAKETHGWWLPTTEHPANNRHRSDNQCNKPHLVDVTELITKEVAADANEALVEIIEVLKTSSLREWELFTHRDLDLNAQSNMPYVYRPRRVGDPAATERDGTQDVLPVSQTGRLKIRSWEAEERGKIGHEPITPVSTSHLGYMSNFNIKLLEQNWHISQYRTYAVFDWTRIRYVHNCEMVKRNSRGYTPPGVARNGKIRQTTEYTLYTPRITGFVVEMVPKDVEGGYYVRVPNSFGGRECNPNLDYEVKTLQRVADRTKKRSVKGGYRGGYQGIEKLKYKEVTLFEHILVSVH